MHSPTDIALPPRFARQSLAGYLRQHLVVIDNTLAVGVSYDTLLVMLEEIGYITTRKNLYNQTCRARRAAHKALPTRQQETRQATPQTFAGGAPIPANGARLIDQDNKADRYLRGGGGGGISHIDLGGLFKS